MARKRGGDFFREKGGWYPYVHYETGGVVEDILFLRTSLVFLFFYFFKTKQGFTPKKLRRIVLRPKTNGNPCGNSTWFFLDHPWKSTLFIIHPWNLFFYNPWKFHILSFPICSFFFFFFNRSIKGALTKNLSCLVAIKEGGKGAQDM